MSNAYNANNILSCLFLKTISAFAKHIFYMNVRSFCSNAQ